jgi:protein involved in plasmid replication-relaxation
VGTAFAWEVAKRTTERDRELAWFLYRHRILTTAQIQGLFFGSQRRCQDRLLYLYRHRVVDRFYPAGPFALGKPVAHWLLDDVGAYLVAARLGKDRRQLVWDRQRNYAAHGQLAHRLEVNDYVCALIAATVHNERVWVSDWMAGAEAPERWGDGLRRVIPDAVLVLSTPAGPVEVAVEWDRDTEPLATLEHKCVRYAISLASFPKAHVCFVVPSQRRLEGLRDRVCKVVSDQPAYGTRFWGATSTDLAEFGTLGRVWEALDRRDLPQSMLGFEHVEGWWIYPRDHALGRRWQLPLEQRWQQLSPLGTRRHNKAPS